MADPAEFMTADDPSVSSNPAPGTLYGLYLNGELVLKPDAFIGYSYSNDARISNYPQESGAFQSYNKVDTPYDVRISMTKGGKVSDVAAFLALAQSLPKGSDHFLYDLVTPECTYLSGNIQRISHEHKAGHGANMVTIELHMVEIRVTASAQYVNTTSPTTTGNLSNTKTQTGADPKQGGTVQAQMPAPVTVASVTDAIKQAELAQSHAQMTHH